MLGLWTSEIGYQAPTEGGREDNYYVPVTGRKCIILIRLTKLIVAVTGS